MEEIINAWVLKNADHILTISDNEASRLFKYEKDWHYSSKHHDYSEMCICHSLGKIPPPPKHNLVTGFVQIGRRSEIFHYYYKNDEHIVCLFPGQFWYYPEHLTAGDTIKDMQKAAPRNLRCLNRVYFISGDRDEIFDKLRIKYS